MAVPQRRISRSNTRHRRSRWNAEATGLVPIAVHGERHLVPRQLVRAVARGLVDPRTGSPTPPNPSNRSTS